MDTDVADALLTEVTRLAKSTSNCMHTLLALQRTEIDNSRAIAAMTSAFTDSGPVPGCPPSNQEDFLGSLKCDTSDQRKPETDKVGVISFDRVSMAGYDYRQINNGGHQTMHKHQN